MSNIWMRYYLPLGLLVDVGLVMWVRSIWS